MSIVLPFKPFTLEEVAAVTGATAKQLDYWTLTAVPPTLGEDGFTVGLQYHQMFAVFVGVRWLREGAPLPKATAAVKAMGVVRMETLEFDLSEGRSFPALAETTGLKKSVMIAPPDTPLGRRLCLKKMLAEFKAQIDKVFPKG